MDISGYVVLGIVTLFLVYLMPQLVRSRQDVLDSRLGDRFSTGLRILDTAATPGACARIPTDDDAPRAYLHDPRLRTEVAAMNRPLDTRNATPGTRRASPMPDRSAPGPRSTGSAPGGSPAAVPGGAARTGQARTGPDERALAAARRRRAAAKRRLVLTLVLLGLSGWAWAAVATGQATPVLAAAPTTLLLVVLVLGRRAAKAAARAQRLRAGQAPARPAAAPARGASATGRPAAATPPAPARTDAPAGASTAAPTRPSRPRAAQTIVHTTAAAARQTGSLVDENTEILPRLGLTPAEPPKSPEQEEDTFPNSRHDADPAAAREPAGARERAVAHRGEVDGAQGRYVGSAWTPVPVPVPTYTLKPSAPRASAPPYVSPPEQADAARSGAEQEEEGRPEHIDQPAPGDDVVAPSTGTAATGTAATGTAATGAPAFEAGADATASSATGPSATGSSATASSAQATSAPVSSAATTLDLEAVLSRRRAAGE